MAGGRFTLAGSMVGTLIIQSLTTTILTRGVPPEVTLVYKAIVIILVVLINPKTFGDFLVVTLSNLDAAEPWPLHRSQINRPGLFKEGECHETTLKPTQYSDYRHLWRFLSNLSDRIPDV